MGFLERDGIREHADVVVEDRIDEQSAARIPQLLFLIAAEAQLAGIPLRQRPLQLVILLPAVQRPLHMLPDGFGIDVVQEILARHQMIVFPQRLECPITALGCA